MTMGSQFLQSCVRTLSMLSRNVAIPIERGRRDSDLRWPGHHNGQLIL